MSPTNSYPMTGVAKHKSAFGCWIVIHGKVYDVTKYLKEHPGGENILLKSGGKDATLEFEDFGHSGSARAELADLLIGELRAPTKEELKNAAKLREDSNASATRERVVKHLILLLVAVVLAITLGKYKH